MLSVCINACKPDEPEDQNEEEVITTMNLYFTDTASKQTTKFQAKDPDGDGGQALTVDTIKLDANKFYTLRVEFLNEIENPAENITEEVEEESDVHLVTYTPSPASLMNITVTDKDAEQRPIGIQSNVNTTGVASGGLKVMLSHYASSTDKTNNTGRETDIEVDFKVVLK
jgi:hypothetical protein